MFSNLDSIDWQSLGYHTYGRPNEIPQAIRSLLSPEETVIREALGFLLGEGQDFGDIYDTTPHIIPFCLEALALQGAPGKAIILRQLSGQGMYIADAGAHSVHMLDLCVRTYAALRAGLDLYLDLLAHGDQDEKVAACELLQYMTDDPEQLFPVLLERATQESDEEVLVNLFYAVKRLFASLEWPRFALKKQYAPGLRAIVETHPLPAVRVAAARASVELINRYRLYGEELLSPQVGDLLVGAFLHPHPPQHWTEEIPSLFQEYLVRDLAHLSDPAPLLRLLAEPEITAAQAHVLARGLLCQVAVNQVLHSPHWQRMTSRDERKLGDFYRGEHTVVPGKYNSRRLRPVLQAILAADRVWERPTNLFSFFYGLPDSRDELARLVAEMTT
jgi:hypothetical protein